MIYPKNFESKIGFSEIRTLLRGRCLSAMGSDEVAKMTFSSDVAEVNRMLATVKEFRSIMDGDTDFPVQNITDMRAALLRLQIKGTYIDEQDLFALRNTVDTLSAISEFLLERDEAAHPAFGKSSEEGEPQAPYKYPLLARMANQVKVFPRFIIQVDSILNNFGKVKDLPLLTLLGFVNRWLAPGAVSAFHSAMCLTRHRRVAMWIRILLPPIAMVALLSRSSRR